MKETVNSKAKDVEMVSNPPANTKSKQNDPKRDKQLNNDDDDDEDDDDDISDIDEYLDWRSKKAYK